MGTNAMSEPLTENAMKLVLSGDVLASGPVLWLKYGPKYAFAAIAGFLSIDIEPLFMSLNLVPYMVLNAAELIYGSCMALAKVAKKNSFLQSSSRHELFSESQLPTMGKNIQTLQKDCATYMIKWKQHGSNNSISASSLEGTMSFVSSPEYKEVRQGVMGGGNVVVHALFLKRIFCLLCGVVVSVERTRDACESDSRLKSVLDSQKKRSQRKEFGDTRKYVCTIK